jgi:ADP-ribose pyrophosphatase YjhB (NUDIX family)
MKFCSNCAAPVVHRIPPGDSLPRYLCVACGEIHYQNPKLIVGTLAEWEGRLMLCRRAIEPRYGYWTLPAGFMELNETVAEGAARETVEESGAEFELEGLFSLVNVARVGQVHLFYRARLLSDRFNPGFGRGQHTELMQAQRNALAQPTAPINQHSEFIQAQRNAYGHYSVPINQEVVRQNESASYYLEASAATLPSDSDAAANLDLVTRGKLDAHDAYDAASAAFVDKFMHDNYFTSLDDIGQAIDALNAIEDLYDLATGDPDKPTDEPAPVRRSRLNGDTVGDTKGGHRGDTAPTPAAAGTQTANRPRRQSAGASAAPNPPHAGRGGGQPDAA